MIRVSTASIRRMLMGKPLGPLQSFIEKKPPIVTSWPISTKLCFSVCATERPDNVLLRKTQCAFPKNDEKARVMFRLTDRRKWFTGNFDHHSRRCWRFATMLK